MATFNRARVCTLGTQEDMVRLCRLLLDHCQWFDEEDDDHPDLTLEQLIALIGKHARLEGGDESTFCYPMVAAPALWQPPPPCSDYPLGKSSFPCESHPRKS
jgi:hypothetical protein